MISITLLVKKDTNVYHSILIASQIVYVDNIKGGMKAIGLSYLTNHIQLSMKDQRPQIEQSTPTVTCTFLPSTTISMA